MPHPTRRTRLTVALSAALAVAVPAVALSAPAAPRRSYRQTPAAYTQRFQTPVAPGVTLTGLSSAVVGANENSNVVSVDLDQPGVRTGLLSSHVTDIASVGTWTQRTGAVAAVNGDYYAIGASNAPQGAVVKSGQLQKGLAVGQPIVGLGTDGAVRTATVTLAGSAHWGSADHPLDAYNSDLNSATMPANGLAVLDGSWGGSALSFARPPKKLGIVAVNANHKVIATYTKPVRITVPSHGLLLVGTGRLSGINGLKKGSTVTEKIGFTTSAPAPFTWALGYGLSLMSGGSVIHNYHDDSDPHDSRTAIGWADGGHQMFLLTVEDGGGSVGEGVNELADEMAAAGATDAVDLDGGGSTTLLARAQGDPAAGLVGALSDGFQRQVPIGVGVFVPKGSGQVAGFTPTLDAGTVFPGLHRVLGYHAWDEWYGPATLKPASAVVTSDNAGLLVADGPTSVRALRTGAGHVVATAPTSAPGSPGTTSGSVYLRVLGPLTGLTPQPDLRVLPGRSAAITLQGTDGQGNAAPVDAADLSLSYDRSLLSVKAASDGTLSVNAKSVPEGVVTPVTMTVQGISTTMTVRIGYATLPLVNPVARGAVRVSGGRSAVVPVARGVAGLRVTPTNATATVFPTPRKGFPAGTARIGVTATGDGGRHALSLQYLDARGGRHVVALGTLTGRTAKRYEVVVPSRGTLLGVTVARSSARHPGFAIITQVVART